MGRRKTPAEGYGCKTQSLMHPDWIDSVRAASPKCPQKTRSTPRRGSQVVLAQLSPAIAMQLAPCFSCLFPTSTSFLFLQVLLEKDVHLPLSA